MKSNNKKKVTCPCCRHQLPQSIANMETLIGFCDNCQMIFKIEQINKKSISILNRIAELIKSMITNRSQNP